MKLLSLNRLQKELDYKFSKQNILITYNPETLDNNPIKGINILLEVLKEFTNVGKIFTYVMNGHFL